MPGEQRAQSGGGVLAAAQDVLDAHMRGLDGVCSCGGRDCPAYQHAQQVMAERRALPKRQPDAARRDLMRRRPLRASLA